MLSFLLPYISPVIIPVFAILSLFVPVLLIMNFVCTIYWLLKLKKQFLLSLIILGIGWFFAPPFYKISSNTSSLNSDLKVMSYNVKTFDLFSNNKAIEKKQNGYDFIAEKNPDILVIQEYYKSKKVQFSFPYKYVKFRSKLVNTEWQFIQSLKY